MICPNCGRELAENEICTCTQTEPTYNPEVNPYSNSQGYPVYESNQESAAAPQYYAPAPNVAPVYDANAQQTYFQPVQTKPAPSTDYPQGYKIKKKYIAVILAWVLGVFGIHNFYLGNNQKAIAQLLLSTVGSIVLVGPIITAVWVLVEAVQLMVDNINADANGYKIQTFAEELAQANKNAE